MSLSPLSSAYKTAKQWRRTSKLHYGFSSWKKKNSLDTRCSCLIIPATYASNRFSAFRQRSAIPLSRENLIEKLRDPAKTSFLPSFLSRFFPERQRNRNKCEQDLTEFFLSFFPPFGTRSFGWRLSFIGFRIRLETRIVSNNVRSIEC